MIHYEKAGITIREGDCLALMPELTENSMDAIVTDPPYGLSFMGREWDHGVPGVPFWEAALRVAKPGAMLLAFGGSRTFHRLAVAIEDAGWEIRDTMMWMYGSGFPKSLDVGKAIDRAAGAEREKIRHAPRPATSGTMSGASDTRPWIERSREAGYHEVDGPIPATDAAKQWDGWGTALKPAFEPIIVARKPIQGTVAANVLTWGVGGINVDGCRVGTEETIAFERKENGVTASGWKDVNRNPYEQNPKGRWPANVILQHSSSCVCTGTKRVRNNSGSISGKEPSVPATGEAVYAERDRVSFSKHADADGLETVEAWICEPDCPVRLLDEQSGERPGATSSSNGKTTAFTTPVSYGTIPGHNDTGGASRFFYTAKADRAERRKSKHPTVKPLDLMRYLVRLVCPIGGTVLDPFMGSGTTIEAARAEHSKAIGFDLSGEYCRDAIARLRQGAFTFE